MSEVADMTLDELHRIGIRRREDDLACGWGLGMADHGLKTWIDDLVEYQDLPTAVADALRQRLLP